MKEKRSMENRKSEIISGAFAAVLVAGLLFLFNPLQLYFSNINDFGAPVAIALPLLLACFAVLAALLFAIPRMSGRFAGRVTAVLVAAGVMLWLQSNVFLWDYGVLDGTQPAWSQFKMQGRMEVLLWLVALGLALWRPAAAALIGARILPALLVLQIITTIATALNSEPAPDFHRYTIIDDHEYDLSRDRNVLVVVLDAFQSDIFGELIAREPGLRESLDGFTWYRDTTAGFAKTYPSVTLFHTGRYYENDRPLREFMAEAFMTDSVPLRLKRAGWDVGLYPYVARTMYFNEALAQNFVPKVPATPPLVVLADLVDPAIFRMAPHVLKPYVLNNYEWVLSGLVGTADAGDDGADAPEPASETETLSTGREIVESDHPHHDVRFVEEFAANASPVIDAPVFRYYHLRAPHAPFALDRNLEMALLDPGRSGFVEHSRAAIAMVERMIETLKALESYDSTALVVVSDHGGGKYFPGIATQYAGRAITARDTGSISEEEQASAMSLLLLKPFGERGELRILDAPVSNADLAATLDRLTLDKGGFPGMPVQDVAEDAQRERRHLFYRFESWLPSYLPDLTEYAIRGFSWDPASWHATGTVFVSGEEYVPPTPPEDFRMPLGKEVFTKYASPGAAVIGEGWSGPESDFVWSNAREATLRLPFPERLFGEVLVSLRLNPYRAGGRLPPPLVILRNGNTELLRTAMEAYGTVTVPVQLDPKGQEELVLTLDLPDAISPRQALVGLDERILGIAVYGVRVDPVVPLEDDMELTFTTGGNGHVYLAEGWSAPEGWSTWTERSHATLRLPLAPELRGHAIEMELVLRPYLGGGKVPRQRVEAYLDGERVAAWAFSETSKPRLSLNASQTSTDTLEIRLALPDAASPTEVEGSSDERQLGIALHSLTITARD